MSPVSWDAFLSIFSLLNPSILDLGSGTGQTDGQTDDSHQRLMPPSCGGAGKLNKTLPLKLCHSDVIVVSRWFYFLLK